MEKYDTTLYFCGTEKELEKDVIASIGKDAKPLFPVYEVLFNGNVFRLCVSGGFIGDRNDVKGQFLQLESNGPINITVKGYLKLRALIKLCNDDERVYMQEIQDGPTPTHTKLKKAFERVDAIGFDKLCILTVIDSRSHVEILNCFNVVKVREAESYGQ